jgi:hypothetical protein
MIELNSLFIKCLLNNLRYDYRKFEPPLWLQLSTYEQYVALNLQVRL